MDSQSFYRLVTEGSLAGAYIIRDGKFIYVNTSLARIFGYSTEEIMSGRVASEDLVHPDDLELVRDNLRRRLAGEVASLHYTFRGRRRDGAEIICEVLGDRVEYRGRPAVVGTLLDVTDRTRAEEALRISEGNYRAIFNAVDSAIAVMELETGNFVDVNDKWCQMAGYSPEEARGLNVAVLCLDNPPYTAADALYWIREASKDGPRVFEYQAKTREGRRHWVEINLRRVFLGGQERLLAVVRDITERKGGEEALRASESKYRNLVEQIPAITYMAALDDLSSLIYVSPQIEAILGFTPEEFLADPEMFVKRIHPGDRDRVLTEQLLSYAEGGTFAAEYRMLSRSGRVVWIRDESRAVYDSERRPLFMQGVALDITGRKKAEERLEEANNKLRALVQASPLAIVSLDPQGKVIIWNPASERIFGWRQEEVLGRPIPIMADDKKEECENIWNRVRQGEPLMGLELQRRRKDGTLIDVSLSTALLYDGAGQVAGVMGVFENITARKGAEEALRESEARFRAMFEGAPIGIAVADLQHGTIVGNTTLREMGGGFSESEISRIKGEEVTHPDDWEADNALFTELVAGKRNTFQKETRYRHKEGHWIWARLSVSLVKDAAGQPQFAICMVEDITQRKKAEEAAEEVRRQQEALLNNIPDLAWLKDRESRVIMVNEQYGLACGRAPGEVIGKMDSEIWSPDLAAKYRADDLEVMRSGRPKRMEEPVRDHQGGTFWVETIKAPIFNERREVVGTAGIARDIMARRRIAEALRKVSRALKAVTECHQGMLRATNEAELLSEVCRIIVEVGGYRMAWVGYTRADETKSVQIMAQVGLDEGYAKTMKVTWADEPLGRGPVGTAIRTGRPAITRDTQTDPRFALWRQEALRRGYASVLALPLGDAQPFGALAIYAVEVNAFDDEEINLLLGLANDLAYGIKALRTGAERFRAEEALRESEQKYRSLIDGANDAIVLTDPQGRITEVNHKAVDLLGYTKEQLLSLNYEELHPPKILTHVRENFAEILRTGRSRLHECQVRRQDGQIVPVDITHVVVGSGEHRVIQALFRDVTERKRAGEALRDSEQKLRRLASQLLTVQEKERRRVSRELHDELGQSLTVLKIHLVAIENGLLAEQQGLKEGCERLLGYIDGVIENVRRLSWDLSPSILEDLGLSSSLKYLIQEICRNNDMTYTVAMAEIDDLFSPEVQINIYRIFQEALTNIVRHAQATRLEVKISTPGDRVIFSLKDDGQGFELKKARSRHFSKKGLGLTTMNERALIAEGNLRIWSRKGRGTGIVLTIPVQKEG